MKLQARQIDSFLKSPDKAARVILVYGPDTGLISERCRQLGMTVVADYNDPFNVAVLSAEQLQDDPARLQDEASAISMMGGDRLVRIEDASDKLTSLIKSYLEAPSAHALVILQAGALGAQSSLRKLCEGAKNAAALPCYVEDSRDLTKLARDTLRDAGLDIQPDALSWLAGHIAGDRQRARSELEKLILYKGDDRSPVSLEDVSACCGDAGALGLDDLVNAVASRQSAAAMRAYDVLMQEGTAFIVILRALQSHFRKLHLTRARMESGQSAESAIKALRPPLFFKQEPAFRQQLQNWSLSALSKVLARLNDLEAECKQTGAPVDTLCAQAVLGLSSAGRRAA